MITLLKTNSSNLLEFEEEFVKRNLSYTVTSKVPRRLSRGLVKPNSLKRWMNRKIKNKPPVVVSGGGNDHHLTYGICATIKKPFSYIHIDRHSDFGTASEPYVCMGGFVDSLIQRTNANTGLLIGCDNIAKYPTIPYTLESLEKSLPEYLDTLLDDVYISVDLDVLLSSQFRSGYFTGRMSVAQLNSTLNQIISKKNIIGGDICGYIGDDQKSLEIAVDVIETIYSTVY